MTITIGEKPLEQLAAAIDKISATKINDLKAAADKARFDRLNAAATDERYAVAFRTALRGLSRLGLELEAVAPCRSRSLTPPAECSDDRYA